MKLKDIIAKDLRIVMRDKTALIFILLMPIVLIVILSFALGGMFASEGFSIGSVNVAIVDNDEPQTAHQAQAASLYAVLDSEDIAAFLNYHNADAQTAEDQLAANEVDAVITIPEGFMAAVMDAMAGNGVSTELAVTGSPQSTMRAGIVAAITRSYTDTLSMLASDMTLLKQTAASGGFAGQALAQLDTSSFMQQLAASPSVDIGYQSVPARRALSSFAYYTIAITCMFVLYSAGQGSAFLYMENEQHTLPRMLVAGISVRKLLLGKSFTVFLICLAQLAMLFGFSTLVFGIEWGDPLGFAAISGGVAFSVTGLGTLLMVLVYRAGNPSIGNVFQAVIVQVMALVGGSFLPLSVLPAFFGTLALFTPNGLAVLAFTGNVSGAPFSEILPFIAGSFAFGIVLFTLGAALFPRGRRV